MESNLVLLFNSIYGASGICVYMNSAANGLTANQRGRMAAIATAAQTNSLTSPGEDLETLHCIQQVMAMAKDNAP